MDGITAGVDLAASPQTTAVAVIEWSAGGAVVRSVTSRASDAMIDELTGEAERVGIDCPFGWPQPFLDFVTHHQRGWPVDEAEHKEQREALVYRATDRYWIREVGKRPLSVSADQIAHAAFRCASLLTKLRSDGDHSGAGRLVETYPGGSLHVWGGEFRSSGYKSATKRAALSANVDVLTARLPGLRYTPDAGAAVRESDHAFDAVVAAITARAHHRGLVRDIPPESRAVARVEGWIAVPTADSLGPGLFG